MKEMPVATTVEDTGITLNAPDPVPIVTPAKAAGLVPIDDTKKRPRRS
jgi:hypothetical protein